MKYWGAEQEAAIVEFNTNEMVDIKHKIYNDIILPAFKKLVVTASLAAVSPALVSNVQV